MARFLCTEEHAKKSRLLSTLFTQKIKLPFERGCCWCSPRLRYLVTHVVVVVQTRSRSRGSFLGGGNRNREGLRRPNVSNPNFPDPIHYPTCLFESRQTVRMWLLSLCPAPALTHAHTHAIVVVRSRSRLRENFFRRRRSDEALQGCSSRVPAGTPRPSRG